MPPDWSPFRVAGPDERLPGPRGITTTPGLGDRLRTAAFAERQAAEAFAWAAARFGEAPAPLLAFWRDAAVEESLHMKLLLDRMSALGVRADERAVSDGLWRSLSRCAAREEFSAAMRRAEERGRAAELSFQRSLAQSDPVTAALFARIAADEERHIASADLAAGA